MPKGRFAPGDNCGAKNVNFKDGRSQWPERAAWENMIDRCYNRFDAGYANYGGRSIKVCDAWQESFDAFLSDMGRKPSQSHSLDRKDNDGNYTPENCRWSTRQEQNLNKRNNRKVDWNGRIQTISEWARETGLSHHTIWIRLNRGWTVEKTLTKPSQRS